MTRFVILFAIAFSLSGCTTMLRKNASKVNPGMSREEVTKILGVPDDRQFNGNQEALQFCSQTDYFIIWLNDGKVSGMNSYTKAETLYGCTAGIEPVRWEMAPNAVLEVRNR
jgi:hypothetical protein